MPHRLMKFIEAYYLDMPMSVVAAIVTSVTGVLALAWNALGDFFAIVTPDELANMSDGTFLKVVIVVLAGAMGWVMKWVAGTMIPTLAKNTEATTRQSESNDRVADAISMLTNRIDNIDLPRRSRNNS